MSNPAPSTIAALLRPECIQLNLKARQKNAALRETAELLIPTKAITNFDTFYREILERERLSNTALGHNVAIPHARTDQCQEILVAVGRSQEGIEFDAKSVDLVRLIFLIGTPKQMVTDYLRLVSSLSRLLRSDDMREQLLTAPDAATFIETIRQAEG